MGENPFEKLTEDMNRNLEELKLLVEKNHEAAEAAKKAGIAVPDEIEYARQLIKEEEEKQLRPLAEVCLGNKDVLAATLSARIAKNASHLTDIAFFLSILNEEDRENILSRMSDKERSMITGAVDNLPYIPRYDKDNILFNVQAEYFMRLDGEEPDIDLFTDLFK